MVKILLINPGSTKEIYSKSKVRFGVPQTPSLSLASVAAPIKTGANDTIEILDLGVEKNPEKSLSKILRIQNPDYVGLTFTTPQYPTVKYLAQKIKEYDNKILIVAGGPHSTALPQETLSTTMLDVVAVGEADYTLRDITQSRRLQDIRGIYFKNAEGRIVATQKRGLISELDTLPYPSLDLFDAKKYNSPRVISRRNPTAALETSRGCVFNCIYCNKNIFERKFRPKSPKRVIEEIKYAQNLGFKEIQVMDDGFSTDLNRAKEICDLIMSEDLDLSWSLQNGIRADRVDAEFLEKAAKAGCHRISYGVETGDQKLLNSIGKGESLDDIRKAFKLTHKAGIRTTAFFLFGLPGETKETMRKTIEFAKELDPDLAKVAIMTPFPGTRIFDVWAKEGVILSWDWGKYNQHNPSEVYAHPNLSWDTILEYYDRFYNEFYMNAHYAWKRIKTGIPNGELFYHIYYGFKL